MKTRFVLFVFLLLLTIFIGRGISASMMVCNSSPAVFPSIIGASAARPIPGKEAPLAAIRGILLTLPPPRPLLNTLEIATRSPYNVMA